MSQARTEIIFFSIFPQLSSAEFFVRPVEKALGQPRNIVGPAAYGGISSNPALNLEFGKKLRKKLEKLVSERFICAKNCEKCPKPLSRGLICSKYQLEPEENDF